MPIYWKRKYTKLGTMMGKRDRKNGICLADAAKCVAWRGLRSELSCNLKAWK